MQSWTIMQFVLWKELNTLNARIYKDIFYMAKRVLKSQTDLSSAVGFIKYFAQSRTKLNWNPKFLQNENTFNMWNNTFVSFISCFYFQIIRQKDLCFNIYMYIYIVFLASPGALEVILVTPWVSEWVSDR